MIEITPHITEAAKKLVSQDSVLPMKIPGAPAFVVAKADDDTVQAFGAFTHNDVNYKIGAVKSSS